MTRLVLILIFALVLEAIGVVFLSAGLKEIGAMQRVNASEIARVVRVGLTNSKILLGVALETAFFVCLMILLSRHDVSLIWPLTALGFVLTALSARFILHEQVSVTRWAGVILIVIGAGLVSWSEKAKERKEKTPDAVVSRVRSGLQ
jgi:drug/metabolite transporter (DMT)-like permease